MAIKICVAGGTGWTGSLVVKAISSSKEFQTSSGKHKFKRAQLPMWHQYRVELWPNFGQPFGVKDAKENSLNFAQAFRRSRTTHEPKGIIELVR